MGTSLSQDKTTSALDAVRVLTTQHHALLIIEEALSDVVSLEQARREAHEAMTQAKAERDAMLATLETERATAQRQLEDIAARAAEARADLEQSRAAIRGERAAADSELAVLDARRAEIEAAAQQLAETRQRMSAMLA